MLALIFAAAQISQAGVVPAAHVPRMLSPDNKLTTGCVIGWDDKSVFILTCAHGKEADDEMIIWWRGNTTTPAHGKVVAHDAKKDLALVQCTDHWPKMTPPHVIPADVTQPKPGDKVAQFGYGNRQYRKIESKIIRDEWGKWDDGSVRLTTRTEGNSYPGDSGGPIIWNGWLVGVTSSFYNANRSHDCGYVRSVEIREFLKANNFAHFVGNPPKKR